MLNDPSLHQDLDRDLAGIAALQPEAPSLSHFEFWPAWLFYLPVKVYGVLLGLRHRGLTLPTIANPLFDAGGFVGESKHQILCQLPESLADRVAPHVALQRSGADSQAVATDVQNALAAMKDRGFSFPCVAKPDLGARGAGVQRVFSEADLARYIAAFPLDELIVLQELFDLPGEAGVFYIRMPGADRGWLFSLTLKFFPEVVGDGVRTLEALIREDSRASSIAHLYLERHAERLEWVVPAGQRYRIAFAGSHSRGTIFRDGSHLLTADMQQAWDALARQIPEFWFGRFDVRYNSLEDLQQARNIRIVEVNGAGAEATHIWDSRTELWSAWTTLFRQYRLLFTIGAMNRQRGFKPMPLRALLSRIRDNKRRPDLYPHTH